MGIINEFLRKVFFKIGERIGQKPVFFIVCSILTSLFFGSGLAWFHYDGDFERLFTTRGGRSELEREQVDTYFPPGGRGSFNPSRRTRIGSFARVIIEAADGGTLFRQAVWNEILQVDDLIHSASPAWRRNYSSLCGKWDEECFENRFLDLSEVMGQIENGSLRVNYPIMFNPETFNAHVIPMHFGGLNISNDSLTVDSARAIGLYYFLDAGTEEEQAHQWELEVMDGIDYAKQYWKNIIVYLRTVSTERQEQLKIIYEPMPYISGTMIIMSLFLGVTSLNTDWVRAKPYAAILGMVCCGFGTVAGIGLVSFFGLPIIGMTSSVPFIMIGIGIDDAFVILAAWRQTNPLDDVPKRMAHCYAEAGVSITITTLTDMLSFYVGLITPVEGIQIFSAYAGTCVIFIYLLQVFLFGAFLALSGRQEAKNRHGLLWWMEAMPKSKSGGKSRMFRLFCTGGIDKTNSRTTDSKPEIGVMIWFQTTFSTFLMKFWAKAFVMAVFLVYLAVSCYGLTTLETGMKYNAVYKVGSIMHTFHEKEEYYFRKYPYRIQVLVTTPLDYSNKTVQHQITNMISEMNATGHIALGYSENWFDAYTRYIKAYSDRFKMNFTHSQSFIDALRENFLNSSSAAFREDVKFNDDFTEILASRFILQSKGGASKVDLKNIAAALREIADNQTEFQVSIYNPFFVTTDIDFILEKLTFQLLGTACAIVMAVTILFLPSFVCSITVFVTMLTTELGVVGFMCLWGLRLDLLTLLGLVICIGFAVDFTAHMSYAYISAEGSPEDRIRKAMYSLGKPILQGGISTIMAISALLLIPNYGYEAMAKVVILVISFSAFHALFVLPVFFLMIRPERFSCNSGSSTKSLKLGTNNSNGNYNVNISNPSQDIQAKKVVSAST